MASTIRRGLVTLGILAGALGVLGLASHSLGTSPGSASVAVPDASPVTFQLESPSGTPLRTFQHEGQTYVMGSHGDRYQIRVTNHGTRRVEALVSVDGRDVVTGKPGDFATGRGYIVPAGDSVVIEGFRRSLNQVAGFRFTTPGGSYSAKMGTPQNVGVIGLAVFEEGADATAKAPPHVARQPAESPASDPVAAAPAGPPGKFERRRPAPAKAGKGTVGRGALGGFGSHGRPTDTDSLDEVAGGSGRRQDNLGTAWGSTRVSRAVETPFQRSATGTPSRVLTVRYDNAAGLRARGIDIGTSNVRNPQAFPQARGFAKAPPSRWARR